MKTRIRILSLLLALLLALPLIYGGIAHATDGSDAENESPVDPELAETLETQAIEYVEKFVNTAYLNLEEDFETGTILASGVVEGIPGSTTVNIGDSDVSVTDLQDSITQFAEVAEYQKLVRSTYEIERHNFVADYSILSTSVEGDTALVEVYAELSFQYEVGGETAVFGDVYEVCFTNDSDTWYIASAVSEEMVSYGMTADVFDCSVATTEFLETYASGAEVAGTTEVISEISDAVAASSTTYFSNKRYYDANDATAYAYTYTTSTFTGYVGNNCNFINGNFYNYGDVNCQNFVSQCIWAGLNGNDRLDYIDKDVYPMDNEGTYKWYGNRPDTSGITTWTNVLRFDEYVRGSNTEVTSSGLKTSIYKVNGGTSFAGIPNATTRLLGAALGVRNSDGSRHAVMITGITGTSFADVTYCANAPMRKAAKLKDNFFCFQNRTIDVYIPRYFDIVNVCSGHTYQSYSTSIAPSGKGTICTKCGYNALTVSGTLYRPFPVGTTKTITGITPTYCYRLAIGITTPSGTTTWHNILSASQISRAYTFSEKGLYTITISVRDISDSNADSNAVSHVFKVRTY